MSDEVYLIDGARTPQGRYGGALASVRPDDLAALVVGEAVRRAGAPADSVDEVILGAANQAGEDNRDVARMAVLLAGLPHTVPGYTVNRLCASGLTAVASAVQSIRAGEADLVVVSGVESMTRAPWVMAKPGTPWARPGDVHDTSLGWRFTNPRFPATTTLSMGETAEEVAALDGISRLEADAFALRSHRRAVAARTAGRFAAEIVPVPVADGEMTEDEGPRPTTTLEKLSSLRTVFRPGGIVTAGNSSPLSDGAAALVVASGAAVERHGLTPRARVVTASSAGVEPHLMGLGPVPATARALERAGWAAEDLDAIELNEAFAAQVLACTREWGLTDTDFERFNVNGSGISLGHPVGATGGRILATLLRELDRRQARYGLETMCLGGGQGLAAVFERPTDATHVHGGR